MPRTTNPHALAIVMGAALACALTGGPAIGATGQADSPLFALNTEWAAAAGSPQPVDLLGECFPNPFNPAATIRYELAGPTPVQLRIYDLQGRLVRNLVDGFVRDGGRYTVTWDGRDDAGRMSATGVYLYRLQTERATEARRMTLVK